MITSCQTIKDLRTVAETIDQRVHELNCEGAGGSHDEKLRVELEQLMGIRRAVGAMIN